MPMLQQYRRQALISSAAFLVFAILSKLYPGPLRIYIDAWVGDIGIVACLYFLLATFLPRVKLLYKGIIIAGIAVGVELFQGSGMPGSWHLPAPFVWVLGSRFDPFDFIFYFCGIVVAVLIDSKLVKKIYEK